MSLNPTEFVDSDWLLTCDEEDRTPLLISNQPDKVLMEKWHEKQFLRTEIKDFTFKSTHLSSFDIICPMSLANKRDSCS